MYTRLSWELERRGKIKNEGIELYYEKGKINILVDRKLHVIKDNNELVNLGNRNHKISEVVEDILRIFL
ncbi:hypothetical protein [Clostridium thailandense]|uniref:Uncharacterized protein n=1 Tax=Clostridium thailandense TaxID=2794346 RepID=A0A949WTG4_9CLOT|nr:hypothetical protein [Clostridium thailandense]MBV7276171.1 hypothetical protein [Clostridium thailandense]MCH5137553.1 hypothetical protein [Clostridiaceae bacterium UIB06]